MGIIKNFYDLLFLILTMCNQLTKVVITVEDNNNITYLLSHTLSIAL